ncbi:MAG TPA: type II toxin-antitoxin system death-on-curing family toxin [Ktedonobacteraceae bacterium]|jgi:death on curing protein|nr:type II toxin-antitoxin system death-on-curing family toxin [Ktedonobacteraceae bacterium]
MKIRFLPETIVLTIQEDQIRLYGGSYSTRDAAALDAALHMPQAQFGEQFLHATIFHMAAAYGFHLCQNHPFVDGNKRTAGMAMFTFFLLNGLEPIATEVEYYEVMMAVASGQMSKEQLAEWLSIVVRGSPPDVMIE